MEEQEWRRTSPGRRRAFPTRSNSGLEGSRVLVHSHSARPPQAGVGCGVVPGGLLVEVVAPAPGMGCCPAWFLGSTVLCWALLWIRSANPYAPPPPAGLSKGHSDIFPKLPWTEPG